MNALAHAVEALYAPDATPETTTVAETAIRALAEALPRLVAAPDQLDGRAQALYGAWLAGWSLGATTMGLHHRLAHVLGGSYGLPHADTHSALLPQVAAFNALAAPDAFASMAEALKIEDSGHVAPTLYDLARRVTAATTLAELGLPDSAVHEVAANVAAAAAAGSVVNPRPVTEGGLERLLRSAYAGDRPRPNE
jgi:maleylacetate reductase